MAFNFHSMSVSSSYSSDDRQMIPSEPWWTPYEATRWNWRFALWHDWDVWVEFQSRLGQDIKIGYSY